MRAGIPRPTVFIEGNDEDFVWRDARPSSPILPGLHHLRNGCIREFVVGGKSLEIL